MERTVTIKNVLATEAELRAALAKFEKPSVINGRYVDTGAGGLVMIANVAGWYESCPELVEISIKGRTDRSANFSESTLRKLISLLQEVQVEKGWK